MIISSFSALHAPAPNVRYIYAWIRPLRVGFSRWGPDRPSAVPPGLSSARLPTKPSPPPSPSGTHQSPLDGDTEDDQSSRAFTSYLTESNNLPTANTGTTANQAQSTVPNQGNHAHLPELTCNRSATPGHNNTNQQLQPTALTGGTSPHTSTPTWAQIATVTPQTSSGARLLNTSPSSLPCTSNPHVRVIVFCRGGKGKTLWVLLHSKEYPRRLSSFRGALQWKPRSGASVIFKPKSSTTTIGDLVHYSATKPTLCTHVHLHDRSRRMVPRYLQGRQRPVQG